MNDFLVDLLNNVLANIVFFLGGAGVFVLILLKQQKRKNYFFFKASRNRHIDVYLSSAKLEDAEIVAHSGTTDKYTGTVLLKGEFRIIPDITSLFSTRFTIADAFSSLVDAYTEAQKPEIKYIPSPSSFGEEKDFFSLRNRTIICIGGPKFNAVSNYYQEVGKPIFKVIKDEEKCEIQFIRKGRVQKIFERDNGKDIGALIKLYDKANDNVVFIAAGLGINATCAAVVYLKENWKALSSKYPDKEFGVFLQCDHFRKNETGYMERPDLEFSFESQEI